MLGCGLVFSVPIMVAMEDIVKTPFVLNLYKMSLHGKLYRKTLFVSIDNNISCIKPYKKLSLKKNQQEKTYVYR